MGPPAPSSNGNFGNGTSNGIMASSSGPEPYSLPAHLLDEILMFQPEGKLMYQDDRDWLQSQSADVVMEDAHASPGSSEGAARKRPFGKRMPIDREEIVRLILQGLRDIGYHQSADVLAKESGYTLASPASLDFQAAILGGRWAEATALLPELGVYGDASGQPLSCSSSVRSGKGKATGTGNAADRATFLIAQQKYLEFLEAGQQKKALTVLRAELATCATDSDALHDLSGYMMCLDRQDLYERANWDGAEGISRRQLLERLQEFISPRVMVPSRRLATLLDQARQHQQQACLYHDDNEPVSLYTDHQCEIGTFPSVTSHILADHDDEVWRVEWSPDGNYLASASKDHTVVVWQLRHEPGERYPFSMIPLHHLVGHSDEVDCLAWSPNGETIVTAADRKIYIWNARTGTRVSGGEHTLHQDTVSSIQFLPDGSQFIVTSMDCRVIFYDLTGAVVRNWNLNNIQIIDFGITADATRMVALTKYMGRDGAQGKAKPTISMRVADSSTLAVPGSRHDVDTNFEYGTMPSGLLVIRIADKEIIDQLTDIQSSNVSSLKFSHDGKRVLLSCAPDELQLFSIEPLHLVRKFSGHIQDQFLIRSCFGAPKDRYVLSGSEGEQLAFETRLTADHHVYVWQTNGTTPVHVLAGHTKAVNAVAWNPVLSRKLFASCSDDHTVRLWQPPVRTDEEEMDGAGETEAEGMEL